MEGEREESVNTRRDVCMTGCVDRWMSKEMDEWMSEWTDGMEMLVAWMR